MTGGNFPNPLSLKSYDFLGQEFKFKYNASGKYKTILGGVLSVVTLTILSIASWIIISQTMNTATPVISITPSYSTVYPKIDLYKEGFFTGLGIVLNNNLLPVDQISKYVTITCNVVEVQPDGTGGVFPIFHDPIPYVPCREVNNPELLRQINLDPGVAQLMLGFALCPDLTPETVFYLKGKSSAPPRFTMELNIWPCSLAVPGDCLPIEGNKVLIHYTVTNKIADYSNFDDPISISYHLESFVHIMTTVSKTFQMNFKTNEIWDETRDFSKESLRFKYADLDEMSYSPSSRSALQSHCTELQIRSYTCAYYISFDFYSTGKKIKVLRVYPKFLQALAKLGGIFGFITLVATSIYSYYNKKQRRKFLKKRIFKIEDDEEIQRILFSGSKQGLKNQKDGNPFKIFQGSSKSIIKGKKKPTRESRLATQIIQKNLQDNEDGAVLFEKLNFVSFFEKVFLQEHDKVLLPLVLLNLEKNALLKNERSSQKLQLGKSAKTGLKHIHPKQNEEEKEMTINQAYQSMLDFHPKTSVSKAIREFFLKNLPPLINNCNLKQGDGTIQFPLNKLEQTSGKHKQSIGEESSFFTAVGENSTLQNSSSNRKHSKDSIYKPQELFKSGFSPNKKKVKTFKKKKKKMLKVKKKSKERSATNQIVMNPTPIEVNSDDHDYFD